MIDHEVSNLFDEADNNAKELANIYFKVKSSIQINRTLEESLDFEQLKIEELKKFYSHHFNVAGIKCLKGMFFDEYNCFPKCQDIPDKYFCPIKPDFYFISHRWESIGHPDPSASQFNVIKRYYNNLSTETRSNWGFWYDFSCLPQANHLNERSNEETITFNNGLRLMHGLPYLSATIILFDDDYLSRTWCIAEWIMARKISPIQYKTEITIPFGNYLKFHHIALIVLQLVKDDNYRKEFKLGNDFETIGYLTSLVNGALLESKNTTGTDREMVTSIVYEHLNIDLNFIGYRTQIIIAFLLLDRFPKAIVHQIFLHFLIFTKDPQLSWTKFPTFNFEGLTGVTTPTDSIFFRGEIVKKSNSC